MTRAIHHRLWKYHNGSQGAADAVPPDENTSSTYPKCFECHDICTCCFTSGYSCRPKFSIRSQQREHVLTLHKRVTNPRLTAGVTGTGGDITSNIYASSSVDTCAFPLRGCPGNVASHGMALNLACVGALHQSYWDEMNVEKLDIGPWALTQTKWQYPGSAITTIIRFTILLWVNWGN